MRSLGFLFSEALTSLRRHGLLTAAAVSTIAIVLTLMSSFAVTFYQIDTVGHRAVNDFDMRVFCRPEVKKAQLRGIKERIEAIPGVRRPVGYISREQAFKDQTRNQPIDASDIPNLFNETFVVKLSDPVRAPQIAREIRTWQDVVQEVALPEQEMAGMLHIVGVLRVVGLVAGAGLLLCALVVVSNTIRASLESRKGELRIMQIVGASPWFIRFPLFVEGMIHGVIGGVLAALGFAFTARWINQVIIQQFPMMARYFDIGYSIKLVCLAILTVGALIGAIGSLLSMRRYLR